MIKLNVGGTLFHTTRETLTKTQDSFFTAMLSGRFQQLVDQEGYIFIDRDGDRFKHILNYLRTNTIHLPRHANKLYKYEDIIEEAEFYGLNELAEILRKEVRVISNQAKIEQLRVASAAAAVQQQQNTLLESPNKRKKPNVFAGVPLIGPDRFSSPLDRTKRSPKAPRFAPMLEDFPEVENFTEDC